MNDFKTYGPRDEASREDGDASLTGVDESLPAQELPAGFVSGARNKRFRITGIGGRQRRCMTREGITLLPWMKTNGKTAFTEVYGGFVYEDVAQGGQWIVIAADGGVWKTRPSYVATPVALPAGVAALTKGTFRKFLQCNGEILLLRGAGNETLHCTNLEAGFTRIAQRNVWGVSFDHSTNWVGLTEHNLEVGDPVRFTVGAGTGLPASVTADATYYVLETPNGDGFTISDTPGGTQVIFSTGPGDAAVDTGSVRVLDGAEPIPACEDGIAFGNRAILVRSADVADANSIQDRLVITDIGEVTRAQVLGSEFRINTGDGFSLITVQVFQEDNLVCFKSGKVQKVTGVSGDLSGAQGPLNVTDAYGAIGTRGVRVYGNNIFWMNSELRLTSLQLTALNQDQSTDVALSDTLVKTFGRVNATYAAGIAVEVYDGFLLCALPLDEAEIVDGTELVMTGQTYTASVAVTVGVTAGLTYKYFQGTGGGRLVNGTESLRGDCNFVAQGATVSLFAAGVAFTACLDSLRRVIASGVNTGVAVYDFLNQAWAGTDEAAGVTHVVDWLKFEYGGRPRLGFIGADGWLHLYGEGYEDDLLVSQAPYVDVLVDGLPAAGQTLQVNGGTVITAAVQQHNATIGGPVFQWGCGGGGGLGDTGIAEARANLWTDGVGGFSAGGAAPWSAPNTVVTQTDEGVRFTATDGNPVVVKVNGVVATEGFNGVGSWCLVDGHGAQEIVGVGIADWVRTRAYRCLVYYGSQSETGVMRRFLQTALLLGTWQPSYTIRALVQGQEAEREYVTGETRDRTKYFAPFDRGDFDGTNGGDNYDEARREDYSTSLDSGGILLGSGVTWDGVQEYVHRVPVSENGLWLQVEVENEGGRLELIAVAMESEEGQVLSGPAVA